jgi:RNA polymerase subunit RPABC4/transcription elongation factor Spt4
VYPGARSSLWGTPQVTYTLVKGNQNMAMKKCKECGQAISTKADSCPNCGCKTKSKKNGCVGCLVIVIVAFFIAIIITFNSSSDYDRKSKNEPRQEKQKKQYPFQLLNEKNETLKVGDKTKLNTMYLYEIGDTYIERELIDFCIEIRRKMQSYNHISYISTFYDKKENAQFPKQKFTALYGAEEEKQKHIKAFFWYNKVNGYSKLTIYEKNAWESVGREIDIK